MKSTNPNGAGERGNPVTWTYDDLYRLTGQQKAGQVCTYTLDSVGNLRTMWEGGSFPKTFTFNAADRLVTMVEGASVTTYAYTGYGALESEVTGNQTTTYRYNGQDQLTGVTAPSGVRSTYTFDGDGMRRAAQEGNVAPTTMVWDGSDYLLLSEPTGNRVVLSLESEVVACGTKDLLTDPLGSLVKEISAGAALGSLIELYPYGTLATGAPTIPYVYIAASGYYTDTVDRDYVRARELMKKLGRWMQTDPLWPEEMAYCYVGGTPLALLDPSGMFCQAQQSNPCSDLKGPQGACIALLCSFKNVDDMIKFLRRGIKVDPGDLRGIEKLVRDLWGKKFSPEECCKKASGRPALGTMEWLINLLCSNSWLRGKDPVWLACAKKHPRGRGFGGDPEENDKCHACCDKQFPVEGPFDRLRGLCEKACDGV